MENLTIIETNLRKACALYKGYEYRIHRKNKCGTITWLCRKERSENCKGRILTKGDDVMKESSHVCKSDFAATEVKLCLHKAKKRAREEETPNSTVYNQEMRQIIQKGYEFVTEVPDYPSKKHTLNRIRRKEQGFQAEPKEAENIELNDKLLAINGGTENFLLVDDQSDERILIFATRKGKETLSENSHCFVDGTFKSCSKQFQQIFTIFTNSFVNLKILVLL